MKTSQLQVLRKLKDDLPYYARKNLHILDKSGTLIPFIFNKAQWHIHNKLEAQKKKLGYIRAVIVKGRQQGASTYISSRGFHRTTLVPGTNAFILTHHADSTRHLFGMPKRFYENAPPPILPQIQALNERRLEFANIGSSYNVGTAGSANIGRSLTIQFFHGCVSEDSLIVLENGRAKTMSDIKVGDSILTSSGDFAKVCQKIYTGQKQTYTLRCWNSGEEVHITADHKVLTCTGYKKMSELTTSDFVAMPKVKLTGEIECYEHTLLNPPRSHGGGVKHLEYFKYPLNYDFGYLLGYYLAEGHVKDNLGYFTLAYHKGEKFIFKALEGTFGTETSFKHKVVGNRGVTTVYGKFIATALNSICGRVEGKHIPSWFFKTNEDFIKGVIRGYLNGDGSKTDPSKISAPSIHERISRQMRRLVMAVYGACSINKHERQRYFQKTKDIYLLRITGETLRKYSGEGERHRVEKSYVKDGVVYCRVRSIASRKIEHVWDIEVDHPDHNYQTTTGVISNSECAFWENTDDIMTGVIQAIPDLPGTEIIFESTAKGVGGMFHSLAMLGLDEKSESEFMTIFTPWFWQPEYYKEPPANFIMDDEEEGLAEQFGLSPGQIYFRRRKIIDAFKGLKWLFCQEYPNTIQEAFVVSGDTLFSGELVTEARKNNTQDPMAPLVIGCDPAREGDRTVVVMRRGREIVKHTVYETMDEMTLAGILGGLIDRHPIIKCFVDVGNGYGTLDRLREQGYGKFVNGVNFGATALFPDIYVNKRAEMHDLCRQWFEQGGVNIPDSDEFHMDLLAIPPLESKGSRNRLALPPKKDIKKAFGKSTDICDALVLTFAFPVAPDANQQRIRRVEFDGTRRSSPLNTVRDFNRQGNQKQRIYRANLDLT